MLLPEAREGEIFSAMSLFFGFVNSIKVSSIVVIIQMLKNVGIGC